jgi:hypothetical protein
MSELRFEDPPEVSRILGRRGKHKEAAEELRSRPGEWAIVGVYGTGASSAAMARHIGDGFVTAYRPAGSFEGLARTVDGEARVYARYVGETEA